MQITQIKCDNCGADLSFNPETQEYSCEYCMSSFSQADIEEITAKQEEKREKSEDFSNHSAIFTCKSCGAEVISDENTAATFCAYCGSPIALSGRIADELCPDLIIPFKISKEKATEEFRKWCKSKWFVPKAFKSESQMEKITGLYVPYWLSDCKLDAQIITESKDIKRVSSEVTKVKVYESHRRGKIQYYKIPADASSKLNDKLMDAIEPFDYKETVDFDRSYLQGFYADKFDVDKNDVLDRIKKRAEDGACEYLRKNITGYDSVIIKDKASSIIKNKWNYAFLPIWVLNYTHKGVKYEFMMNGQTGRFVGRLPIAAGKLYLFAAFVSFIITMVGGCIWDNL